MFNLSVPWWEFVVRGFAVYVFLFTMLRVTGKRQVGQLDAFDLILLLVLSNAVQNSMNAGDNSLVGGLISATTLIFINWGVAYLAYLYPPLEKLLEGRPIVLVRDGKIRQDVLEKEHITHQELETALRRGGAFTYKNVKLAVLETNGQVSVRTADGSG